MDGMRKPKYYFDETWMENFWFFLGWKPKDCERYLQKHWNFETLCLNGSGKTIEFVNEKGKAAIVIWTDKKPIDPMSISVLAHECVHAVHMALNRRGVKADFDNDEVEAYLVAKLMREAMR